MKKLLALATAAILAVSMTVSVSAKTVFEKDFRTSQNLDEFIPSPNAGMDFIEPTFDANGMQVKAPTNFFTSIIDFSKSGIEMNSGKYYLISMEGKALVDKPHWYTMILQLLGTGADPDNGKGDWQNIDSPDGSVVVADGKGYPINEDGTFKCVGLIKPEYISSDRYTEITGVCAWGTYNNHPKEYELYYIKIEECDENGVVTGGAATTVATGNTDAAATSDKGSADTGVEGVAVVAGLALIGAGAVVISRKKK